jgi:hypothetical protein
MRLAFALLLFGCAHTSIATNDLITGDGMPGNLRCVSHNESGQCTIYASAQPTADEFKAMAAKLGLRSVIKLNLAALEGRDIVPDGVEQFEHPWSPFGPVTEEQITEALTDVYWAPKPVLIHCTHGEDRTGLLVALWRVKYEHSLPFAAWMEWRAHGKNVVWDKLFDLAFEKATHWKP